MIQLNKNYSLPDALADTVPVKVVSVGGAGLNALDRIVLDGLEKASVVAINTDVQSLTSSVAAHKVQLGRTMTRGLGTGGDPELGYDAAVESVDEIREALADARMIFVCAGLGGGTGSGADRKSTRLNSSHRTISYAVFCLKKKMKDTIFLKSIIFANSENGLPSFSQ